MFTEQEVLQAQDAWGSGIVKIGSLKEDRAACEAAALDHIDTLYALEMGTVLFKPTKAAEVQFRADREAFLSYFIGGNDKFPEDGGFATAPFTAVKFENSGIILEENRAIAMGNYFFTSPDGTITKVEYTFGYKKDAAGNIKIDLHHSSIPYAG